MQINKWCFGLVLVFLSCLLWAQEPSAVWYQIDKNKQVSLRVEMFLSSTCPHCQKADSFFKSIETSTPWIEVHRHYINQDKNALILFNQYLQQQNSTNFSVPSIFFCNSRWVGFDESQNSGKALLQGMELCRKQIEKKGTLTLNTANVLNKMASTSMFEASLTATSKSVVFMPLMALIDALNPCAFILVVLLYVALILPETRMQRALVATLFLVIVGLLHIFQQNSFISLYTGSWFRIPAAVIGCALIGYALYVFRKKEWSFVLGLLIILLLSVAVQIYQQACSPNIAMIYKQWLGSQSYSDNKKELLLILYNIIYILVVGLVAFLIFSLVNMKRLQRYRPLVRLFCYGFLLIVAATLIINPFYIASAVYTVGTIIVATLIAHLFKWIMTKRKE